MNSPILMGKHVGGKNLLNYLYSPGIDQIKYVYISVGGGGLALPSAHTTVHVHSPL